MGRLWKLSKIWNRRGFTLIELLIVVAIIAILAAIAVPNFLEAQVRSKVSRTLADMRTVVTALESYAVDHNRYPETDLGLTFLSSNNLRGPLRLTTPVAYLTSLPSSPWNENLGSETGNPKIASGWNGFLYVRAIGVPGITTNTPGTELDANYVGDRAAYLGPFASFQEQAAVSRQGSWVLKSVGPDNVDNRDGQNPANQALGITPALARVYDPTNGTVSSGDIVVFSDRRGGSLR